MMGFTPLFLRGKQMKLSPLKPPGPIWIDNWFMNRNKTTTEYQVVQRKQVIGKCLIVYLLMRLMLTDETEFSSQPCFCQHHLLWLMTSFV